MNRIIEFLTLACLATGNTLASPELAKAKNCTQCHAVDKKLVGPAFKDVATKYTDDKDAEERLAKKILEGSSDVWGPMQMPPNPQVNAKEAKILSKWVLLQK